MRPANQREIDAILKALRAEESAQRWARMWSHLQYSAPRPYRRAIGDHVIAAARLWTMVNPEFIIIKEARRS